MAKWEPIDNVDAKIKEIVGKDYKEIFGRECCGYTKNQFNFLRQADSTFRDSM